MIDIYDLNLSGSDLIFKDYNAVRVESVLVNQGFYKYFETYGINLDFWLKTETIYNIEAFIEFLSTELLKFEIPVEEITVDEIGDSIVSLKVNIKLYNEEVITYGL